MYKYIAMIISLILCLIACSGDQGEERRLVGRRAVGGEVEALRGGRGDRGRGGREAQLHRLQQQVDPGLGLGVVHGQSVGESSQLPGQGRGAVGQAEAGGGQAANGILELCVSGEGVLLREAAVQQLSAMCRADATVGEKRDLGGKHCVQTQPASALGVSRAIQA